MERNETFTEAVIREVREETGLVIENPKLCSIYHWFIDSVHQIVYIYLAEKYTGELQSSEEGQVFWISEKDFLEKDLAPGMNAVVRLNVGIVLLGKSFFKENKMSLKQGGIFRIIKF